jgi:hypothetical protein
MVNYTIKFSKELELVTVDYHVETEAGKTDRISTLSLYVNGKDVFTKNASGNTKLFGTELVTLVDETKDVRVGFAVSDTTGYTASGDDVLRGGHPFDDAQFLG